VGSAGGVGISAQGEIKGGNHHSKIRREAMKKLIFFSVAAIFFCSIIAAANSFAFHHQGMDWVYQGSSVSESDPHLKHFVWETARSPYGPFDTIALHRYVRQNHEWIGDPYGPAKDPRKVLFLIPGTWDRGQGKGSDPNISETWFFAANGYDVYSIEFRTGYIPNLSYAQFQEFGLGDALKATADWTYGVFREDIKACVEVAKSISRAHKLFMAGRSRGGMQMWMYAAKYGKQDLKGLISLDGGGPYVLVDTNPGKQMTQAYFQYLVGLFKQGVLPGYLFLTEVSGYEAAQFAGAVPFATTTVGGPLPPVAALTFPPGTPPDKAQMKYVSDLIAYGAYYAWGAGMVTNYYKPYPGGAGETYMDREVLVAIESNFSRYWPNIQTLETGAMTNYADCPFLDYDDTAEVDLPIIFFGSKFGCAAMGACYNPESPVGPGQSVVARTASTDVTSILLLNYGHLDIFAGTHSLEEVKQPALEWMNDRLK
jgi:pimeloyl-ACP methyl ester carboxylesterase